MRTRTVASWPRASPAAMEMSGHTDLRFEIHGAVQVQRLERSAPGKTRARLSGPSWRAFGPVISIGHCGGANECLTQFRSADSLMSQNCLPEGCPPISAMRPGRRKLMRGESLIAWVERNELGSNLAMIPSSPERGRKNA